MKHYRVILMLLWSTSALVSGGFCSDKSVGSYFADYDSDCRQYVLCVSQSGQGLKFDCPPGEQYWTPSSLLFCLIGTKFSQQTSVCHHQASIICKKKTEETEESSGSEESLRNDVSMKVRLNINGDGSDWMSWTSSCCYKWHISLIILPHSLLIGDS